MSAWTKQLAAQVKKHGKAKASWYCEWDEPDGTRRMKSCGPGPSGKKAAGRMKERIKAELLTGTYDRQAKVTWSEFRKRYVDRVRAELAVGSIESILTSINHFERLLRLTNKNMSAISNARIEFFKVERGKERGNKPGSTLSRATLNKDLRHIKAGLRWAKDNGYLEEMPKIRPVKEPKRLPNYVTPEHFAVIYGACDAAIRPTGLACDPCEWWRALLVMAYMTGWRIGELLALRWEDVDLDNGRALTRWSDNKGDRDELVYLHPVVVDHLRQIKSFDPLVFPWNKSRRALNAEFARIQTAAGIHLTCRDQRPHDCTPACHLYGFHDERRAFATMNAPNMTREALQALMRHRSSLTTERYINMSRQLNPAVANLHVPDVLQAVSG